MISINLLHILFLFTTCVLVATAARKYLTYRGVQLILIGANFILLAYCTFHWNTYIIQYATESFSLKLNSNTWMGINYELNFKINSLSFLFIFLVNIIGSATNIYILNYFKYEEREEEFILLINWFILSMILLVSGNNFFTLILGWELIGLTSFLLINFWKFKITTLSCSFKAFTFNKFSDLFLMLSFCLLWNVFKINNVDTLLMQLSMNKVYNNGLLYFSAITLFICASVKSAQIFGHLWLPDSMEAPVPASSLIHSATLVSAGIYLLLKFQTLYNMTNLHNLIFIVGAITACYGGLVAASQTDVKKLLAYSTISHCGFIFVTIALNNFVITIIYLYLHGLFKAVSFFCVGSLIKYNNTQDTRLMGMSKTQVFNTIALVVASTNLGGLPFTFGYMYKQTFLLYLINSNFNIIGYGCVIIGMLSSVVYVYKLIYYSCFDYRKGALQTNVLILQNYNNLHSYLSFNFTYLKLFAFFILYGYAVFFFIIVQFYIFKLYLFFYHLPETTTNELRFLQNFIILKSSLISVFYTLFTATVLYLVLNSWRTNYFFIEKITLLRQVFLLLCTLSTVNFFLKYLSSVFIFLI